MYQLPHRSLAISGSPYFEATESTKFESWEIECKRLLVERVDLFKEERVLERLSEADGNTSEENDMGRLSGPTKASSDPVADNIAPW